MNNINITNLVSENQDLQLKINEVESKEKELKKELSGYQKTFKANANKILGVLSQNGSLTLKGTPTVLNTTAQWNILKKKYDFHGIYQRNQGLKTLTAGAKYVIAKTRERYGSYYTVDNNSNIKFVSEHGSPSTFTLISRKLTDLE